MTRNVGSQGMSIAAWMPLVGLVLSFACGDAAAQNNSLYRAVGASGDDRPLSMQQGSLVRSEPVVPRPIGRHDIFTVRIEELSRFSSEGESQRRRTMNLLAVMQDWTRLNGLTKAERTQQNTGLDPRIQGQFQDQIRAQSDLETAERLTLNLAVEVVDIRPNGNLVLEGQKEIEINEEQWIVRLTGTCRQEDIGQDRVVLSENIADLQIERKLAGQVHDGWRRGWLIRAMDKVSPF
ncbi:MAG TPA: hypothetical protein DCQ98_10010 [Planctomycetaceae bacterium]|nr:hypothetical protein [Planctomycetaceae bacterium]HRF00503.1 flagellar basal body L-ring protein FlgH [Pirellulaceae bacterium]